MKKSFWIYFIIGLLLSAVSIQLPEIVLWLFSAWDATFHTQLLPSLLTQNVVSFSAIKGAHQILILLSLAFTLWQGFRCVRGWQASSRHLSSEKMAWQLEDLKTRNQCLEDENKQLKAYIETLKRALEKLNP